MIPPALLLLLLLGSTAHADQREIEVSGWLNCADKGGNWHHMSGVQVTLWEEDLSFNPAFDPHDEVATFGPTRSNGKFKLKGNHSEFFAVRYFISVDAPCKGEDKDAWQQSCQDKEFASKCARRFSGYEPKSAFFTHRFEYNPDGEELVKSKYSLDCGLGLAFTDGFTCGGSLCKGDWCGHPID